MEKALTQTNRVDPFRDSEKYLLFVTFSQSPSKNYAMAINISLGALKYSEEILGNKRIHVVGFEKSRVGAARARALLDLVGDWKGVQIFAGGKVLQSIWGIKSVLECFASASACEDHKAHCHTVLEDPFIKVASGGMAEIIRSAVKRSIEKKLAGEDYVEPIKTSECYLFPCRLLQNRVREINPDHPSELKDQVQALAIREGCDWCPYFKAGDFRKLGDKINI